MNRYRIPDVPAPRPKAHHVVWLLASRRLGTAEHRARRRCLQGLSRTCSGGGV